MFTTLLRVIILLLYDFAAGSHLGGIASQTEVKELAESTSAYRDDRWEGLERSVPVYGSWRQCYFGLVHRISLHGAYRSESFRLGDGTWSTYCLDTFRCLKRHLSRKFVNLFLYYVYLLLTCVLCVEYYTNILYICLYILKTWFLWYE